MQPPEHTASPAFSLQCHNRYRSHTYPPALRNPERARNTNMGPPNKGTAYHPTKGTSPPTPPQPSNNIDKPLTSRHIPDNYQLPRGGNHTRSTATTWRLPTGTIDWKKILPRITPMVAMRLLKPHQVQLTQAMHLFITTQGTAAMEGTALGDDNQTLQARPTHAILDKRNNRYRHYRRHQPGVDGYPLYPGLRQGRPQTD